MGISITKKNLHWCSWGAPLKQENSDVIFHEKKQIKQVRIQWVKEKDKYLINKTTSSLNNFKQKN